MPAVTITESDLTAFDPSLTGDKAQAMIDDALALAARIAPCVNDADFAYEAAARAIIRGAILRWNEAGTGALQSQTAGPFGQTVDTRQQRRSMFWPSEITDLAALCNANANAGRAYELDTMPTDAGATQDEDLLWFPAGQGWT